MSEGNLKRELKKRAAFDSVEQETFLNLMRTCDQLGFVFAKLFRRYELTPSQYNVLRILRGEGKPMSCQEVGARMVQTVPAMTGLLDRLESQGLVRRERATEDRRVVQVVIAPQGLRRLKQLDAPVLELHRQQFGHLSRTELETLNRLLEKARQTVTH